MAAFTSNTYNVDKLPMEGNLWFKSLYNADISGAEEIIAAAAGKSHYITKIVIRTATALTVTIGSGETDSGVKTAHLGPIPFDAASGVHIQTYPEGYGLKCTAGAAVVADASASGAIWMEVYGKTCKDIV